MVTSVLKHYYLGMMVFLENNDRNISCCRLIKINNISSHNMQHHITLKFAKETIDFIYV
jgi:hypothetical protein